MPSAHRTFTTSSAVDLVYSFLADFANAEEWDPGTVECERVEGDGGVGTRYRNVSSFLGRKTTVEYVARELDEPRFLHFEGNNDQFTGHDRITLEAAGSGTQVTYDATFDFHGGAKLAVPVVALYMPVLANKTVNHMRERLDRLGSGI
jgi:carbon monoxide dehydrogenase subunit G